jgi:hypothetical protein
LKNNDNASNGFGGALSAELQRAQAAIDSDRLCRDPRLFGR